MTDAPRRKMFARSSIQSRVVKGIFHISTGAASGLLVASHAAMTLPHSAFLYFLHSSMLSKAQRENTCAARSATDLFIQPRVSEKTTPLHQGHQLRGREARVENPWHVHNVPQNAVVRSARFTAKLLLRNGEQGQQAAAPQSHAGRRSKVTAVAEDNLSMRPCRAVPSQRGRRPRR